MNRSSSIVAASTAAPNENIAWSYLQLQRLRQIVQEAERSRTPHDVSIEATGFRINPQREHQA
jgi:hypothetical protein